MEGYPCLDQQNRSWPETLIMRVGFDSVHGNGALTKAGDKDKDGIGRWNL